MRLLFLVVFVLLEVMTPAMVTRWPSAKRSGPFSREKS